MRYHQSITVVLAVFCVSVFLFAGCGQKEDKKQSMTIEPKGEKTMAAQYAFDFPALSDEHIRQNYVSVPYKIHHNKHFNFSVLMNKNWNAVKVAEPSQIPADGSTVEIGLLKLFSPIHDPAGAITAQLLFYIAEIPANVSAAEHLDKQLPLIYRDKSLKILQAKTVDTNLGPSKDILFSYTSDNTLFLSRICAFKVKDDTKEYLVGEKQLLYAIELTTEEKDYEGFIAEAFHAAKVSFNPGAE